MNSSSKSCYIVATRICSNVRSESIFCSISVCLSCCHHGHVACSWGQPTRWLLIRGWKLG